MSNSTNQTIKSSAERPTRVRAADGRENAIARAMVYVFALLLGPLVSTHAQETDARMVRTRPQQSVAAATAAGADDEADVAALRAETLERLRAYEPTATTSQGPAKASSASALPAAPLAGAPETASSASPSSDHGTKKSQPALLQERLRLLNEYDAGCVALQKALHPDPSPAQQAAEAREELLRLRQALSQSDQKVDNLLPPLFRGKPAKVSSSLGSEMKDAIDSTATELKDWKTKLETLRSEIANWNNRMNARRNDRDALFQRVTASDGPERRVQIGRNGRARPSWTAGWQMSG